jgi:hypothetical protein
MPWPEWTRSIVVCDPCETLVQCFGLGLCLSVYEEGHGTPVPTAGIQVHCALRSPDPHRQRVISRIQFRGCILLLLFCLED